MARTIDVGAASSRLPWWILVLVVPFAAYHVLLLYSDLTRPEPIGFALGTSDSGLVVRSLAAGSPAARAGLETGDRVLRANGRAVSTRLDWLSVEMNLRAGDPLELEVARRGDRLAPVIRLARVPWRYWATPAGAVLLGVRGLQSLTLLMALVVAFRRGSQPGARVGLWVLATLAVYSIVWPYQIAAIWRALPSSAGLVLWLPFASSLVIAPALFTFFAVFPRAVVRSRWAWVAIWSPMVPALVPPLRFAWDVVYRPDMVRGVNDWTPLTAAVSVGYAIAAIGVLLVGYRRLTDVTERRRVRVLVVGCAFGVLCAVLVVIGYWMPSEVNLTYSIFASPAVAIGLIGALALPASFTYAILRHRLFDVRLIVRRGLRYALARRVLISIGPGAVGVFVADLWINRQIAFVDIVRARGWAYLGLAAFALVARIRRNAWLDALDRRFFRERLTTQRLLKGIGDDVRKAASLDGVASRVVSEIEAALHPEIVALYLRRPLEAVYRAVAVTPATADPDAMPSEAKVIGLLRWLRKPLRIARDEEAWVAQQLPHEELALIRRSGIELIVPVSMEDGVPEALIALGPKRSEEPYAGEDEDLLMAVGDSLALLLARASAPSADREAFEECPACGACYDFGVGRCARDGSVLTVASVPRLLAGRYRIDRRVGRGGMGTVYAAIDEALDRAVAAKLLREDLVTPRAAERFRTEARLAAALAHPNVVTVHDFGMTASGRAFFIMELLDGMTLREELQRSGRLPASRVRAITWAVASAVEAAHGRQMIHRDLKPENVFLCRCEDGSELPKILDFGLAKVLEATGGARLTDPGLVAGTPQYMAPEHRAGDEPSPDWDLWALAVMAFETITGCLPRMDATGTLSNAEDLPVGLRPLFRRSLSRDPLDRPTSAREFSDELDRGLSADALRS